MAILGLETSAIFLFITVSVFIGEMSVWGMSLLVVGLVVTTVLGFVRLSKV